MAFLYLTINELGDPRHAIAERTKFLRRSSRLSQTRLAELVSIDRSWISRIETGVANPRLDLLVHIASTFGVSLCMLTAPLYDGWESDLLSSRIDIPPDQKLRIYGTLEPKDLGQLRRRS